MKNKTFYLQVSRTCNERMLDCQRIHHYLVCNGWVPIKHSDQADLLIISTCASSNPEEVYSEELIKRYDKIRNNESTMVVVGCIAAINPERIKIFNNCIFLSPSEIDKLDNILNSKIHLSAISEPNIISKKDVPYNAFERYIIQFKMLFSKKYNKTMLSFSYIIKNILNRILLIKAHINPYITTYHTDYYYLRISNGCVGECSYCAIKFGIGRLRSRPLEEIISEFKEGLSSEKNMFIVSAEDTGCYGIDIGSNIVGLLKELSKAGEGYNYNLIIINFNARWLVKYYTDLKEYISKNKNILYYLQIPIQSGSNKILKQMNRPYIIEDVIRCIKGIKSIMPELPLATDIIVGFPGETQEDHEATKHLVQDIDFCFMDVFGYEDRLNTVASKLNNKIKSTLVENRVNEIMKIQSKKTKITSLIKKAFEII
ncbi:MAG: radical SAM protein, partial [Candidatus Omnitrophica bacterium]|nr:radical SAM protein [Candidatus Omnitrophota bacterium]